MTTIRPGERCYHRPTSRSVVVEAICDGGRAARCHWASAAWTAHATPRRVPDEAFVCPVGEVEPYSQVAGLRQM